jgi:ADP-ribose pyrophosphatase YjhB (NUDIX family)
LHSHASYTFCPICAARLELKTQMGELHQSCPVCGWVHFEDPKVACAALLIEQDRVLLVQRTMEPFRGLWSLPAGFVNAFERPEDAVIRETLEETGLTVTVDRLFTVLTGREHPRGSDILMVYLVTRSGGTLVAGDDAGEVGWFPLDALPPLAFESTKSILSQASQDINAAH